MKISIALLAGLLIASPAAAQNMPDPSAWRPLRVAKWSVAGGAAGAALYGFFHNQLADDAWDRLELACEEDHDRCEDRLPGGAYADPAMEAEYQTVQRHDRRARAGILGGQIGIATSAVLFILDLRNDRPPPNIPFEPRGFELRRTDDGGLSVGYRLPSR